MMKLPLRQYCFIAFIFLLLAISSVSFAANLLKNGNLEGDDISEFTRTYGSIATVSLFSEESGNRCAKLVIHQLYKPEPNPEVSTSLLIGGITGYSGENGSDAIRVKPNTTYEFAFDIKGDIDTNEHIGLLRAPKLWVWEKDNESGSAGRKEIATTLATNIEVTSEWVRYQGEVTTNATASTAGLRLPIYYTKDDARDFNFSRCYLLVDNVDFREKKEIPPTPDGFAAIRNSGSSNVALSWNTTQDAENYCIYRDSVLRYEVDANATSWVDETAEPDSTYSYSISAKNYKGESAPTEEILAKRMRMVRGIIKGEKEGVTNILPGAEVRVLASQLNPVYSDGNGIFQLGPLVEGEYQFEIRKFQYSKETITRVISVVDPYEYEFDLGELILPWDDKAPNPPTFILADAARHVGIIVLEWEPPAIEPEDVERYNIYRSKTENIDINSVAPIDTVSAETLIYYDRFDAKDFGCTFYYRIQSEDGGGNKEGASNELSETVIAPPIPIPLEPQGGALVAEFPMTFSWQKVENVDFRKYSIQLSSSPDFPNDERTQLLPCNSSPTFTLNSPLIQGTWYWRVNAIYERDVESAWSEAVEFITITTDDNPYLVPYLKITPQVLRQGNVDISYYLTTGANVLIRVFNLKGQHVVTLDTEDKPAGLYTISWNGRDSHGKELQNGLVLVQLKLKTPEKGEKIFTKKVLINR